ncbi:MAG: transcription antitermination factor NusB [Oligoflexia bacterium]|nr:transcription antitermination factor NusB [Oligoflexia bacterium]
MGKRRKSREIAFQLLYARELSGVSGESVINEIRELNIDTDSDVFEYSVQLFGWTVEEQEKIDAGIKEVVSNWSMDRISPIDKNLIRLGCAEMLKGGLAVGIVINEIIELAKEFGDKDSPVFVNGVLDSWYNNVYSS